MEGKGEAGNIAMHCFYGGQTQSRSDNITLCMMTYSSKVNLGFMYSDLALGFIPASYVKRGNGQSPPERAFLLPKAGDRSTSIFSLYYTETVPIVHFTTCYTLNCTLGCFTPSLYMSLWGQL